MWKNTGISNTNMLTALNQSQSALLRLPAEVRNRIYEYALGGNTIWVGFHDHEYMFNSTPLSAGLWGSKEPLALSPVRLAALCNSCRQLRFEATSLYFKSNIFWGNLIKLFSPQNMERHPDLHHVKVVRINLFQRNVMIYDRDLGILVGWAMLKVFAVLRKLKSLEKVIVYYEPDVKDSFQQDVSAEEVLVAMKNVFETRRTGQPVQFVMVVQGH